METGTRPLFKEVIGVATFEINDDRQIEIGFGGFASNENRAAFDFCVVQNGGADKILDQRSKLVHES